MASLIQIRRDISTNWSSVNPILSHGEMGYDVTLNRLKVGNGLTPWNTLAWLDFDITASLNLLDLGIPDGTNGQVLSTNGSASFQFVDMPKDLSDLTDTTGLLTNPVNTSDLVNDSGFITIAAVPTKTSQIVNDSGFLTSAALPTNVSALTNDVGYITIAGVPTDISQLTDTTSLLSQPAGGDGSIQISSGGEFAVAAGASYNNATSKLTLTKLQVASIDGNLVPTTNITQDLGSPTQRWKDIYLSTNTVHLGDNTISIDNDRDLVVNGVKISSSTIINTLLDLKADLEQLAPVALTGNYADLAGIPTGMATQAYVDAAVENIVGAAPAILDTIKELSDALGSDANLAATLAGQISTLEAADAALQAAVASLQTSGGSADAVIAALQAAVTQTETGIANLQTDVGNLGTYTMALGNAVSALQATDSTIAGQITALQTADTATAGQIAALQTADGTTATAISALQNDITTLQTADSLLQNSITALQTADGILATGISDLAAADTVIQTNLAATQAQLDALATVATTGSYSDLTNTPTGMATESYVDAAVANLVSSAPGTLDTLNELATALGNDANFATTIANQLATIQGNITTLQGDAFSGDYNDLTNKPSNLATFDQTGAITFPDGTIQTSAYVPPAGPVVEPPYNGFYAVSTRYSGTDKAFYQIIVANTTEPFTYGKAALNTDNDDFYAEGLSTATSISMFNLYANTSNDVMSPEAIKAVTESFIDNVLHDDTVLVTDAAVAKQRFINYFSTFTSSVINELETNFQFGSEQISGYPFNAANGGNIFITFGIDQASSNYVYYGHDNSQQTGTFTEGETVVIPGDQLGGVTPDNDMTLTIITDNGSYIGATASGVAASLRAFYPIDNINDGGDDQYDTGNFIKTNISGSNNTPYNGGNPVTSADQYWGTGSSYVATYNSGVFAMMAFNTSVESCRYDGGLGYDGDGFVEVTRLIGGSAADEGIDLGDFKFITNKLTTNAGEDIIIQAGFDLYLDAKDDDIYLRAEDDIRIRPGYDFPGDTSNVEFRFTNNGEFLYADGTNQSTAWPFTREATETIYFNGNQGQILTKGPNNDLVWVDTSAVGVTDYNNLSNLPDLSVYATTVYVDTAVAAGGGSASVVISATAPTTPAIGNLWYDESEARAFIWNGTTWVDISPAMSVTGLATETYVNTALANSINEIDGGNAYTAPAAETQIDGNGA